MYRLPGPNARQYIDFSGDQYEHMEDGSTNPTPGKPKNVGDLVRAFRTLETSTFGQEERSVSFL